MKNLRSFGLLVVAQGMIFALPAMGTEPPSATVTYQDCQRLVDYQPSEGVDYQPGVDVHGRAVAPADLGGGFQYQPPKSFSFPLEFTPIDREGFEQTTLGLGQIEVSENGRAYFNGRPLQSDDQAALSRKCQSIVRGHS
ncbi:MAG: hypothetical protein AAF530_01965 [Pseudomonadota bacterium]